MLAGIDAIGGFVQDGSAGSFWVELSGNHITRTASGNSPTALTTSTVTVTPHGGSGASTYSWTRVSGSSSISPTATTSATTAFSASISPDEDLEADFVCTVTNASGAVVSTDPVSVRISLVSTF